MRNLLLSAALIAAPVAVFAAVYTLQAPPAVEASAAGPSLGDMSAFASIVADVQEIAATGDFVAAEKRITDFETDWDDAQKTLRPVNTASWTNVDDAADAALDALRAKAPDSADVTATLAELQAELADPARTPGSDAAGSGVTTISGIATTDATGRTLPCEVMLETFRTTRAAAPLTGAESAQVDALQAKGTERCNADEDVRADDFFAQGLALMTD